LNLVEITIPWNDAEINREKFEKEAVNLGYKLRPFDTKDVMNSTLTVARIKKEEKYKEIIKAADEWLKRNKEEIMIKHKVSDVGIKCSYVIISNLGVVPKAKELYVCRIVSSSDKKKSRYGRMWLKRMVNQAIRGSFECYISAGKEITELDQVAEVNYDTTSLDNSVNMNLWALNEEMGYDARVKERVDVDKVRSLCKNPGAANNLKNFIELPNIDADVVVSKRIIKILKNEADDNEKDIVVKVIKGEEKKKKVDVGKVVDVDDSIEAAIEVGETEAESVEDGGILTSDGEEETIREYATNLCVPILRNLE
jgi:hypothetical protein